MFSELNAYIPILIFLGFVTVVATLMIFMGIIWRPRRPYEKKQSPYECGIAPTGDARVQFVPRYYIYAMLFLAFDVEALFLFPWALVYDKLGLYAFVEMLLFIVILVVGLVYAWAKGALEWRF